MVTGYTKFYEWTAKMRNRYLFSTRKSRTGILLKGTALLLGLTGLGVVIAKVSAPTDPALDQRIDQSIADAVAPIQIPLAIPSSPPETTATLASPPTIETLFSAPVAPLTHSAPLPPSPPVDPSIITKTVKVTSGDSLSTVFARAGLGYQDVDRLMALGDSVAPLKTLHPGDEFSFRLSPDQDFMGLSYQIAPNKSLSVERDENDQLSAQEIVIPMDTRLTTAEGTIDSSLYQSAIETGLSANIVMQLADIFGWKINFLKDVQNGDHFRIVYEEKLLNGKHVGSGRVMAAQFTNSGKTYQAVRYTAPDGKTGYYEPDGASLERGFLRYPVEFSRISSRFNMHRMHPLYHKIRAHKGVDFAAPTGTPIHAASNGRIEFIGWQHGYGKVIKIKHDGGYETVYGHMSRFNGKIKKGSKVDMGQTIGYVGMTGAATGPHLHYEFHVNGVYTDPLAAKLPEANPIPSRYRKDFLAQTQPLVDQIAQTNQASTMRAAHAQKLLAD